MTPAPLRVTPSPAVVAEHLRAACIKRGLSETSVLAGSLKKEAVEARWETVRSVYGSAPGKYTKVGIARRLGLDHTTVVYALMTEEQREARREQNRQRAMRSR